MATGMTNATTSAVKTILTVTVVDSSSSGYQAGRTVTVTNGTDTQTKTTDSGGIASFKLKGAGTYVVSSDAPSGGKTNTVTVEASLGGTYTASIVLSFPWTFSMTFNATTFQTDPTGCLVYADDCAGYTPVSSPPSSLGRCGTIGSWVMNADGTSSNKLLKECFYATFTSSGVPHEKLNPQNLAQKIATWDNTNKEWVSASGASSIASEDTMFCIPTTYVASSATQILISGSASKGTAFAHTIGGRTYQYLGIGVYPSNLTDGKLYSRSGATSTVSTTRPNFRSAATSKTVQNGKAMLWNFYQWNLWRILTFFAMKSFHGQQRIGQGGKSYGAYASGQTNAMGPFAGSTSTSASTSNAVKAFIEDPWGHNYEFIDDFVNGLGTAGKCYIGQNEVPDDTNSNKTQITMPTSSGWGKAISTDARTWGIPTELNGSSSVGLCDYFYGTTSTSGCLGSVGGGSSSMSSGYAGPSYLDANNSLSDSSGSRGARLAFVFDL